MLLLLPGPAAAGDSVRIIINTKVNKLAWIKDGEPVKIFPVATGKHPGFTPEGTFKIVRKVVNPYYNKLKIPGGSPRNPLGMRWLGFDALGTTGGTYGVHGTNNPGSIGKYASAGCIRMYNKDVIWLYDNTPLNTLVEIINRDWEFTEIPVSTVINGRMPVFEPGAGAYLFNNRVMVPARTMAEKMGCTVEWDNKLRRVVLKSGILTVSAAVGSTLILTEGQVREMERPAVLKGGRLFIHVRALADAFGYDIEWDGRNHTVFLDRAL